MDLRVSDEQQQLRATLRRLFDRRVAALVDALPEPPRHDARTDLTDGLAVGLTALGLPEEHGGLGTFADLVAAHEEMGRGLAGPLLPALSVAGRLLIRAEGELRAELLAGLVEGCWTATVAADGRDGVYRHIVCGRDVRNLLAVSGDPATGAPTIDVVPTDAAGLQWSEESSDCDLPSWTVRLGGVAPQHRLTMTADGLDSWRCEAALLAAARQVGGGRAVLERTITHVQTREQFDRPIGTFQAVQHQLADLATELDATELTVAQAAWAVDAGAARAEARRLACIAALSAASAFQHATLVAHQLHGGMGFVLDSPLHLWSARAIADPSVPMTRRQLLDDLSTASGITADDIKAPPEHRAAQAASRG
jgi:alkylation response protein AidB-like acyl-CoA dehydrogenase